MSSNQKNDDNASNQNQNGVSDLNPTVLLIAQELSDLFKAASEKLQLIVNSHSVPNLPNQNAYQPPRDQNICITTNHISSNSNKNITDRNDLNKSIKTTSSNSITDVHQTFKNNEKSFQTISGNHNERSIDGITITLSPKSKTVQSRNGNSASFDDDDDDGDDVEKLIQSALHNFTSQEEEDDGLKSSIENPTADDYNQIIDEVPLKPDEDSILAVTPPVLVPVQPTLAEEVDYSESTQFLNEIEAALRSPRLMDHELEDLDGLPMKKRRIDSVDIELLNEKNNTDKVMFGPRIASSIDTILELDTLFKDQKSPVETLDIQREESESSMLSKAMKIQDSRAVNHHEKSNDSSGEQSTRKLFQRNPIGEVNFKRTNDLTRSVIPLSRRTSIRLSSIRPTQRLQSLERTQSSLTDHKKDNIDSNSSNRKSSISTEESLMTSTSTSPASASPLSLSKRVDNDRIANQSMSKSFGNRISSVRNPYLFESDESLDYSCLISILKSIQEPSSYKKVLTPKMIIKEFERFAGIGKKEEYQNMMTVLLDYAEQ
ncbi:hypothetical protein BY996DRAFT_6411426 [Phakopsora pachyrhizi]|nr:hypothetical protein BY996DRAFT_6411426 [Phakopsora pachyrhizi]